MRGNVAELGRCETCYVELPERQNNRVFLRPLNASSSVFFIFPPPLLDHSNSFSAASPPRHCCKTSSEPSAAAGRPAGFSTMKLAALLALCCLLRLSDCAPPTCYSRALGLSKEVMTLLDKIHTSERTVSAPKHARAHVLCVSRPLLCLPTSRKRVPKFCPRSSLTCT